MRADRSGEVVPGVLARHLIDVPPGLVAVDDLRHMSPHFGPVLRVVAVDQHGDARVAGDVLRPLPLRLGVDEDVLIIGVDPGELRLRLPARHQGHHQGFSRFLLPLSACRS